MEYKFISMTEKEFKKEDYLCIKDIGFKSYLDVLGYEVYKVKIEEGYKGKIIWFVFDVSSSEFADLIKGYENSESKKFYSFLNTNRSTIHHIAKRFSSRDEQ